MLPRIVRPSNIIRLHVLTRCHISTSSTASIRPLLKFNTKSLLSLRFKTTSAKTEGPEPTQKPFTRSALLYHAGTFKITLIAWMKLSTLFIFAFFGFIVTPAYYEKEGLSPTVIRTAFCAVAPVALVAYITSPFVTFVKIRVPPFAVQTVEATMKYVLDQSKKDFLLEINTMSFIAKPRTSLVRLSELKPVNERFGLVNMVRDTTAENARRKWYMFRAVDKFYIPPETGSRRRLWSLLWEKHATRRQ
ncbi:hypothetical protein F5Y08DRAFT_320681 [Xylaria arbuscula]|nr:hypothetical protein F5Y08DRAFT_320681 [Xylaria arbuscula]